MKIEYEIILKKEITDNHRAIFAKMLEEQGKVNPPFGRKAD
jgi:hypothetical protein